MTKPILVANWKNHPSSLFEAKSLLKQLAKHSRVYKKFAFFIAPPLTYFESVSERASFTQLASQDIEIVDILKSFGTKLAIIGHSDKRAMGETDEMVNKKIKIALKSGITPLVCIGELARDQDGEHFEVLRNELRLALAGLTKKAEVSKIMVAYEPVWAIGKSAQEAIGPAELSQTVIFIKKVLSDILGRKVADKITILYGGSVEPANAGDLMRGTGIRGLLVGRASLDAKKLEAIAESILQ